VSIKASVAKPIHLVGQKIQDYRALTKFRLSLTVVYSSLMAYLIASAGSINWWGVLVLGLGGYLVTGAANALNQVLEKDYDALMKRTAERPLPTGRMTTSEAVLAAGLMSLFGITLLALFNPWTALFGTISLVSYSFLYTPLKRISPVAVVVGAVPGALPALIGVVAATGAITPLALALFALQFFWQFPHFWSIAWLSHDDYLRAGYRLLPSTHGQRDRNTGLQSFIYALLLLPIAGTPYLLGVTGPVSGVLVLLLCLGYALMSWKFYACNNRKAALGLMFYSFFFIPVSLLVFFIDKI